MPLDFVLDAQSRLQLEPYSSPLWTDAALVGVAQQGDFGAFEALVKRHQKRVYAVALGMLKNPSEAEEVTQETFLSAFQSLSGFRQDSAFFTWVYRVATNHCLMRLRKKKPEAKGDASALEFLMEASDRGSSWGQRADTTVAEKEFSTALDAALDRLPDDMRAVLVLLAFEGLSMQDIAQMLTLSVPAVKSRLHRARLIVKDALEQELGWAA